MRRMMWGGALMVWVGAQGVAAQSRPIVVIDPGHGGEQAGVRYEDILEKDIVLRMAFALGEELVARGYDVRLTRSGDYAVPGAQRRSMAEDAGAAFFLSLHVNQDEDLTKHGAEIYAHRANPRSAVAAAALSEAFEAMGSAVVSEERPWDFLASPSVPTVMIETAFMSHPVERRLVVSPDFHHELATALADGISTFLGR